MRAAQTIAGLARFEDRVAGSDAERRAAAWLRDQLADARGAPDTRGGPDARTGPDTPGGREAQLEPFWCRPNTALAHAWHVALGLAGSLVAVHSPRIGGALILGALLSLVLDSLTGFSPGRRLTPEHASQNVVSPPPPQHAAKPLRLVITANYDAGRTGLVYQPRLRAAAAQLGELLGPATPGWLGWISLALLGLLAIAIARLEGSGGTAIGVVQVLPTVALVLALALLIELGSSSAGPSAGDNGSGVAVALALARALDSAPPRHLAVEVLLQGAGDTSGIGMQRYLRRRKGERKPAETIVLGIAACAAGAPRWWSTDGQLVPLRYFATLRRLCQTLADDEAALETHPHSGHGSGPALTARTHHIPAITIGCLAEHGIAPQSHQQGDTTDAVQEESLDGALEFALLLVDAIDAHLARTHASSPAPSTRPAPAPAG